MLVGLSKGFRILDGAIALLLDDSFRRPIVVDHQVEGAVTVD